MTLSTKLWHNLIALTGSLVANLLLVGGLLSLNVSPASDGKSAEPLQIRILQKETTTPAGVHRQDMMQEPAELEAKLPTIDLDFEPPPLRPLSLPKLVLSEPLLPTTPQIAVTESVADSVPPPPAASSKLDAPLTAISAPPPPYPEAAARARMEGWVKMMLHINEAGAVTQVETLSMQGHASFQIAVERTLLRWSFHPPTRAGEAIRVRATKTFYFEVRDEE